MFISACGSSAKRGEDFYEYKYTGQKFNIIIISLNNEAQEKLKDNTLFNSNKLAEAVKREINAKGLLSESSNNLVDILVTSIRMRSTFSAVMFGFMAGSDQLDGDVFIKSSSDGKVLNKFSVSVSYALGGLAGGQEDARMNWLYDKFAEITVKNILGEETD